MSIPTSRSKLLKSYEYVGDFHEGLAWAVKGGKRFHIRRDGSPAYEQRYDNVGDFQGGLAWAMQGGKWFRIRRDGTRAG